jgi:TonB-linked SusC/RagA family outer membrane protein
MKKNRMGLVCYNYPVKKILRIMKLTVFLVLLSFVQLLANNLYAQKTKLSVDLKNTSIEMVLLDIENQSSFKFIYNKEKVDVDSRVSIQLKEKSINETLDALFEGKNVFYSFYGNQVILTNSELESTPSIQQKPVSGKVTDSSGVPLPGVSVIIKGKTIGTITDANGNYTLPNVPGDATLQFSFVGMKTQEIAVAGKTTIAVTLTEVTVGLDEVVAVGYGTQRKVNLTGSIAAAKGDVIAKSPVSNLTNALAGNLPGIRAVQRSGEPGSDASSIDIRGFGNALIIVDGVAADFSQLDPAEIESVSILKDGSAAIYGVRAANGVVLVTTKKGTLSKPKITFNSYYAVQSLTRFPSSVNAAQYTELSDEAAINDGRTPVFGKEKVEKYRNREAGYESTDWYDLMIQKYNPQRYSNLTASGGTDATKYFFSLGYFDQEGMWKSDDQKYKRYNFRSNISSKIGKRLTVEFNLSGRLENRDAPSNDTYILMGEMGRMIPTEPAYTNNNPLYLATTNININALALMDKDLVGYVNDKYRHISGIVSLNYELPYIKGLNAKAMYSYQSGTSNNKRWVKKYNLYTYDAATSSYPGSYTGNDPSNLTLKNNQLDEQTLQLSLDYNTTINKKHNIKALLLYERSQGLYSNFSAYREFVLDALDQMFAGSSNNKNNDGSSSEGAKMGYVSRVNYDYDNKYLLEAGFRYDGSSSFPKNSRFGFFPTFSVGWRIINEPFLKNNRLISNMKLRASWGRMGDDGSAIPFSWITGYNFPVGSYIFGDNITQGLQSTGVPNDKLTWYTSTTSNLGLEIGILKNALTFEFDVFRRNRTGLLATRTLTLPGTYGATIPQENLNSDNTRGFELVINYSNKIGDLHYKVSANTSWTRSRNNYIEQASPSNAIENWRNNKSNRWNNIYWGYKSEGQFQSMDEISSWAIQDQNANTSLLPGDIKYEDINNDGLIDDNDMTVIGRGETPELFYGLTLSADYKGFDFSMLFQGASNFNYYSPDGNLQPRSTFARFMDRWHKADMYDPNSAWVPGKYPSTRPGNGIPNNKYTSSFWLEDATYVRLKTLEIGYSIPKTLFSIKGVEQIRFYFSGQNLFTLSKLKEVDPEAPSNNLHYYPQQRVMTLGVNVKF